MAGIQLNLQDQIAGGSASLRSGDDADGGGTVVGGHASTNTDHAGGHASAGTTAAGGHASTEPGIGGHASSYDAGAYRMKEETLALKPSEFSGKEEDWPD